MPRSNPTSGRRGAVPLVCAAATVLLLGAAALGWHRWNLVPAFPPPAANEVLLAMQRSCTVLLAVLGLATIPWALRPEVVPMLGAGLHVLGAVTSTFAVAALRGSAEATLLWVPAVGCGAAAVAIVWVGSRRAGRRTATGPTRTAARARD